MEIPPTFSILRPVCHNQRNCVKDPFISNTTRAIHKRLWLLVLASLTLLLGGCASSPTPGHPEAPTNPSGIQQAIAQSEFGALSAAIYFRDLGYKGNRREIDYDYGKFPDRQRSLILQHTVDAFYGGQYPLRFQTYNKSDLIIYYTSERGWSSFSDFTISVKAYYQDSLVLKFQYQDDNDDQWIKHNASEVMDRLEFGNEVQGDPDEIWGQRSKNLAQHLLQQINDHAELFRRIIQDRDARKRKRKAQWRKQQKQTHDNNMIEVRRLIKNKQFDQALQFIDKIEQQKEFQSDSLPYLKARLLLKTGARDQALAVLQQFVSEHSQKPSKYLDKARQLLHQLQQPAAGN